MKSKLRQLYGKYFRHQAFVLMYHRVATPTMDVWDIAVSPENFEDQLLSLKKAYTVVPLQEITNSIKAGSLKRNVVAITFDDGYADNYLIAKPLLENYNLPATFFVSSGNIGKDTEFWWDELEQIILFSEKLPSKDNLTISSTLIQVNLEGEEILTEAQCQMHCKWKAYEQSPPTLRSQLFLKLWEQIRPLPYEEQQAQIGKIRDWIGIPQSNRKEYSAMSTLQLQDLAKNKLFEIGGHTVSHALLSYYNEEKQLTELIHNRKTLQDITGRTVGALSYPYGNYSDETISAAKETGFEAAFTTEETPIKSQSHLFRLGRIQAKNISGRKLINQLNNF